jgi:hypothetical protein
MAWRRASGLEPSLIAWSDAVFQIGDIMLILAEVAEPDDPVGLSTITLSLPDAAAVSARLQEQGVAVNEGAGGLTIDPSSTLGVPIVLIEAGGG